MACIKTGPLYLSCGSNQSLQVWCKRQPMRVKKIKGVHDDENVAPGDSRVLKALGSINLKITVPFNDS